MAGTTKPFACSYDRAVPETLAALGCSVALTTYQAGKVIFISPAAGGGLVQLTRTFKKAMGLAYSTGRMALACEEEVIRFAGSKSLASHYPNKPDTYDTLFMPRVTFHTGPVDLHDLAFDQSGVLHGVITAFSCLATIGTDHNFNPYWRPPYISSIASGDRCHLNGLAMDKGLPKYVTAFGTGDMPKSWRSTIPGSGVLMDVSTNEILASRLAMPHSPRIHEDRLYLLLSATGEVVEVDRRTGAIRPIIRLNGFVRGLSLHKDHLFVGLSSIRKDSSSFGTLGSNIANAHAGLAIIDLRSGRELGRIHYQASVEEIYDVHVLPDLLRPNILNTLSRDHLNGLSTPEQTFWAPRPTSNRRP
ncbi:MAG: TIGR03032 family protein [Flavobacteriales bacterium]|nr:TIGR03032 family protein [Flavobacteriales bacterium]MCB9193206.1 TIGR03032 family protein [Flavobacteriales bacterium]